MKKRFMPLLLAVILLLSMSCVACRAKADTHPTDLPVQSGDDVPSTEPTTVPTTIPTTQGMTENPEQTLPSDLTEPDVGEIIPSTTNPSVTEPTEAKPEETVPTETEPEEAEPTETDSSATEPVVEDMTPIA